MTLDNGLADRQSDSHSVILRCIEAFEKPVRGLWFEADSHIFHADAYSISPISIGCDDQVSGTIVDCAHRIGTIPKQVQDNLLKLDAIACDARKVVSQFCAHNHPVSLKSTQ